MNSILGWLFAGFIGAAVAIGRTQQRFAVHRIVMTGYDHFNNPPREGLRREIVDLSSYPRGRFSAVLAGYPITEMVITKYAEPDPAGGYQILFKATVEPAPGTTMTNHDLDVLEQRLRLKWQRVGLEVT